MLEQTYVVTSLTFCQHSHTFTHIQKAKERLASSSSLADSSQPTTSAAEPPPSSAPQTNPPTSDAPSSSSAAQLPPPPLQEQEESAYGSASSFVAEAESGPALPDPLSGDTEEWDEGETQLLSPAHPGEELRRPRPTQTLRARELILCSHIHNTHTHTHSTLQLSVYTLVPCSTYAQCTLTIRHQAHPIHCCTSS